jgi:Uma2 family endonuclease
MTQTASLPRYSADDYLRNEEAATAKHEYVDGEVYAMAGAGERHNRIAGNAFFILRTATRGTPCGVFIADMKLRLEQRNAFYYPDVLLTCQADDDHPFYKKSPCLLVEVLSPSTANIDRREKWLAYRTLDSLRAYLLVDSERRHVDYYVLDEAGGWAAGELEEDEVLTVDCGRLSVPLCLDDLYEDIGL